MRARNGKSGDKIDGSLDAQIPLERERKREREKERTRTIHGYGHVAVVTHERTAETRLVEFTERFMEARARPRSTHGPRIEASPLFSMAHRLVTRVLSRRVSDRVASYCVTALVNDSLSFFFFSRSQACAKKGRASSHLEKEEA